MCTRTDRISKAKQVLSGMGVTSTNQQQQTKRKRSRVSFNNQVAVALHERVSSADEIQAIWYKRSELKFFQLEARAQVLRRSNGMMINGIEEFRGLERYSVERTIAKKKCVQSVVLAARLGLNEDSLSLPRQACAPVSPLRVATRRIFFAK